MKNTAEMISVKAASNFVGRFDEARFSEMNRGVESALLRGLRERAFQVYREIANPTPFDEEWRRTDPSLFPFDALRLLPALTSGGAAEPCPWADQFDVVVSVGDDGFAIDDRTGLLGEGRLRVLSLPEAAEACPDLVEGYVDGRALPSEWDKFVALNGAFWNFGLLVHLPAQVELPKGILIRYRLRARDAVLAPRLVVVAERESQATIVETMESPDDSNFLSISTKELYVADAARLRVVSAQEWGRKSCQIGNDMALVGRDARMDWISLNFGTRVSKLKFGSDVQGEGASAELDGLFYCDRDQHIDQKTLQIHSAPNTYSRLLYKGAVQDAGHSVYQGVIQARPGAVKVDAYQTNNNLVLSDGARVDSIPGLLIDADDLKCSHGATIGNLDPEQLFYLRARGLSEPDARRILIRGFYDEILDRIPFDFIRNRVHEIIDRKLSGGKGTDLHEEVG